GQQAACRRHLGQYLQSLRPDLTVRRLHGVGLRPRGWPAGPARIHGRGLLMAARLANAPTTRKQPTSRAVAKPAAAAQALASPTRIAVRKTYKLYVGGALPRSEPGRSYVV